MDTRKPMRRTLHYACVLGLRDHKKLEKTCDQSWSFHVWLLSRFISVTEFAKKLENKKKHKEKEECMKTTFQIQTKEQSYCRK